MKVCVFCERPIATRTASREDTVPKWLQAELEIAEEKVEPTLTSPSGERVAQRIHPVSNLLTGGVCRACNNGWMSELESDVIGILRPLMRSERSLDSLRRAERCVLARWAVKTAYILDHGGLEPRVPREHLHHLYTHRRYLPDNVYVFARQQPGTRPWYYVSAAWWKHSDLTAEARRTVETTSYKLAIQFGDLILIVAFWPLKRWGYRAERKTLHLLWPPTAVPKEYDHPQAEDVSESDAACRRFVVTIGVVPHRGAEGFLAAGAQA